MNVAKTPLGRSLMKSWFLRPLLDFSQIEKRQDAVECFIRPENRAPLIPLAVDEESLIDSARTLIEEIAESIQSQFRLIKNGPRTLSILNMGRGSLRDWQTIWNVRWLLASNGARGAGINLGPI